MNFWGLLRNVLKSPGIGILVVLGLLDWLWGEYLFQCPCSENQIHRRMYSVCFLVVPCLFLVFVDTNWKLCLVRCPGRLCCKTMTRPILLSFAWIVFSLLERNLAVCLLETRACVCTETEKKEDCTDHTKQFAALVRIIIAYIVLFGSAAIAVIGVFVGVCLSKCVTSQSECTEPFQKVCRGCLNCCSQIDCICKCINSKEATDLHSALEKLEDTSSTNGHNPDKGPAGWGHVKFTHSTIMRLEEEDLLPAISKGATISDHGMTKLRGVLTIGEYDKLQRENKRIRANQTTEGNGANGNGSNGNVNNSNENNSNGSNGNVNNSNENNSNGNVNNSNENNSNGSNGNENNDNGEETITTAYN